MVGIWVGGIFAVSFFGSESNVFGDDDGVIAGFKFCNVFGEDIGVIAGFKF